MPDKSRIKEALSNKDTVNVEDTFQQLGKAMQSITIAMKGLSKSSGSSSSDLIEVIIKDWSLTGDVKSGYNVDMIVEIVETGEERMMQIKRKMFIQESVFNEHMEQGKPLRLRRSFLVDD